MPHPPATGGRREMQRMVTIRDWAEAREWHRERMARRWDRANGLVLVLVAVACEVLTTVFGAMALWSLLP